MAQSLFALCRSCNNSTTTCNIFCSQYDLDTRRWGKLWIDWSWRWLMIRLQAALPELRLAITFREIRIAAWRKMFQAVNLPARNGHHLAVTTDHRCLQLILKLHATNRAVINVFIIFCVICCIGILDETAYTLVCYAQGDLSLLQDFVESLIADLIYFVLVCAVIAFGNCYYNARFVRTSQNVLVSSFLTALCIWLTIIRFSEHFNGFLDQTDESHVSAPYCFPNTTLTNILYQIDKIIIPFYSEVAVIALGLSIQMWKSFVPKPSHQVQNELDRSSVCPVFAGRGTKNVLKKLVSKIKLGCRRNLTSKRIDNNNCQLFFYQVYDTSLLKYVRLVWSISLILNLTLFAAFMHLMLGGSDTYDQNETVYILWCIEIAAYLVFCLLFARQSCITRKMVLQSGHFAFNLKGHDMVLLITSSGTFCLYILRIITAVVLLCKDSDLSSSEVELCVICIINSVLAMTTVWQITSFLVSIPMKSFRNRFQAKWVLACLINIIVLCGIGWLTMVVDDKWTISTCWNTLFRISSWTCRKFYPRALP